jgi:hypothetical protein
VFGAVFHLDHAQGGHGALVALAGRDAAVDHRQFDILQHVQLGQQIEELKHEPDLAVADLGQFAGGGVLDHHAIEPDGPGARGIQAAQDMHERGLAAAGGPMIEMNCPASMSSETSSRARISSPPNR